MFVSTLRQGEFYKTLEKYSRGVGSKRISPKVFLEIEIPLPERCVQDQIIERVRGNEESIYSIYSEIAHQKSLLKKLRQSILQDAISGKLTEMWRKENPDVEPATELLEQIKEEKERLVKEKKIKKPEPLPPITEDEIPFKLPEGWVWCRLGELIHGIEAGKSPSCFEYPASDTEWGVIKISAVSWDKFNSNENKRLKPTTLSFPEKEIKPGDFIMSRANTSELVAKSVIVNTTRPKLLLNDKTLRVKFSEYISKQYIQIVNNSKLSRKYYISVAKGSSPSMKNVTRDNIKALLIPVPPIYEVEEIILMVEKLFICCDKLEQQINKSQQDSELLMQAVLKEAFES